MRLRPVALPALFAAGTALANLVIQLDALAKMFPGIAKFLGNFGLPIVALSFVWLAIEIGRLRKDLVAGSKTDEVDNLADQVQRRLDETDKAVELIEHLSPAQRTLLKKILKEPRRFQEDDLDIAPLVDNSLIEIRSRFERGEALFSVTPHLRDVVARALVRNHTPET